MISIFHTEEPLTPIELEAEQVRKEGGTLIVQIARLLENGDLWHAKRSAVKDFLADEIFYYPRKESGFYREVQRYQLHSPDDLYVKKNKTHLDGTREKPQIRLLNILEDVSATQYLVDWVKHLPAQKEAEKKLQAEGVDLSRGYCFEFNGSQQSGINVHQTIFYVPDTTTANVLFTGQGKHSKHTPPAPTKNQFNPGDYQYRIHTLINREKKLVAEHTHKADQQ